MQILVGIILVIALACMPAPATSDQESIGRLTLQVGTEGTKIGLDLKTPGNPSLVIEEEIYIK